MSTRLVPARAFGQLTGQLIYASPHAVRCPYCDEFNAPAPAAPAAIIDCRHCGLPFNPAVALADFEEGFPDVRCEPNSATGE